MNIWHKRFLILQIALLVLYCAVSPFVNLNSLPIMTLFFLLEIGVLEGQRREKPDAVYYRKSCFFALIDLLSVSVFLIYFFLLIFGLENFPQRYITALLIYTAARKFYMLRHYSYIKNPSI